VVHNQEQKRSRGRPQVRSDEDTRSIVIEAANLKFHDMGYAATCISQIAQDAGISTKTLYRLFPAKADLFESVVDNRIERFTLEADIGLAADKGMRERFESVLEAYGRLTLHPDTIAINRLVVAEADRFPEIATAFYKRAILGTARVIETLIRTHVGSGAIAVADIPAAAGMLRGMMAMEPQRAAMLGQREPPTVEEIGQRARMCTDIFLSGCLVR